MNPGLDLLGIVEPPGKIGIRRRYGCCVAGGDGGSLLKLGVFGISGSLAATCGDARQYQEGGSYLEHPAPRKVSGQFYLKSQGLPIKHEDALLEAVPKWNEISHVTTARSCGFVSSLQRKHDQYVNCLLVQTHQTCYFGFSSAGTSRTPGRIVTVELNFL